MKVRKGRERGEEIEKVAEVVREMSLAGSCTKVVTAVVKDDTNVSRLEGLLVRGIAIGETVVRRLVGAFLRRRRDVTDRLGEIGLAIGILGPGPGLGLDLDLDHGLGLDREVLAIQVVVGRNCVH
eukprot:m.84126 g.84126  ORF g.84126 m.84126 type:complete len:125 (+) comp36386_c0_seq2:4977-5351(+)